MVQRALKQIVAAGVFLAGAIQAKGVDTTTTVPLKLTTFNIEWYGLGGDMKGSPQDETRDNTIREFLETHYADTDVFAFEEITDVERLERKVLPAGWSCLSYDHPNPKHQHVVLCHGPNIDFVNDPNDDNNIIEEASLDPEKSRPALHILLRSKKAGIFGRIIAVHLKAYPQETQKRLDQAGVIGKTLKEWQKDGIPTVILGDFNTYPKTDNGQSADDITLIDRVFKNNKTNWQHIDHTAKSTYRKKQNRGQFDQIWTSTTVSHTGAPKVWRACNQDSTAKGFENIEYYNENVSDHCPVTVDLNFPKPQGGSRPRMR